MPSTPAQLKYNPPQRKRAGESRVCPQCGKTFYLQPSRVKRGEVCCSHACRLAAVPKTTKVCPCCGKEFTVPTSVADRYTVCSRECRVAETKYATCERCGKVFWAEKRLNRHFCSEECRRPPQQTACRNCGKTIRYRPSDSDRQFCSFRCYRQFQGETLLEKSVRIILDSLGITYIQEAQMGRYCVDFLLTTERVALEVDGSYWHSNTDRDARKTNYLTARGWRVVRISDQELEAAPNPFALIRSRLQQ
jgi:very-short-patch-repair endonuclease